MRLSISSDIDSEISTRTVPPNRRRCSSSSTASSRSSASSETSKSASLVTRNGAHSVISIFGKSDVSEYVITCSSGQIELPLADADEARQELGDLDARESLLARLRDPGRTRRARATARRCTGTADPARPRAASARDRSPGRRALASSLELLLGAVRDPADQDPFLLERRAQLALPEPRLFGRQPRAPARGSRPASAAASVRPAT